MALARYRAMQSELINRGLASCGAEASDAPRTLVVLGVARGATSLLAGSLHHLGVFLGDEAEPPVFEDQRLAAAFEKSRRLRQRRAVREVLVDYDARHVVWGFKRPGSLHYLRALDASVRNPHYLIVFRDLMAVAQRNALSMDIPLHRGLGGALEGYRRLVEFIDNTHRPMLMISADKALRYRDDYLNAVCEFANLTPTDAQMRAARSFIDPEPAEYLKGSSARTIVGHVETVTSRSISGWATRMKDDGREAIELQLEVNGRVHSRTLNSKLREDVRQRGLHQTGAAGFSFELSEQEALQPLDSIQVRVVLSDEVLPGTDRFYPAAA